MNARTQTHTRTTFARAHSHVHVLHTSQSMRLPGSLKGFSGHVDVETAKRTFESKFKDKTKNSFIGVLSGSPFVKAAGKRVVPIPPTPTHAHIYALAQSRCPPPPTHTHTPIHIQHTRVRAGRQARALNTACDCQHHPTRPLCMRDF
jgi:hypothetical protein